ncbi:MAG: thiamine-phosphate kinase, partial [Solirubrobacterales bacterium]
MGEFELLALLRERLPTAGSQVRLGSGDDAAVTVPGGAVATSVDALVEGVHFRRETATLRQIGRKALSTALSDLAAMGAAPGEAYVWLGAPEDMDEAALLEVGEGLAEVAGETGTTVAGGDLTRAPVLSLAVTVTGHAPKPDDFVTRGGAHPGDVLVVTGELGGAAAGLALIEEPTLAGDPDPRQGLERPSAQRLDAQAADALRRRQLDPTPRLAAGRALAVAGATAMIDVSDGLAGDAGHIATASAALLVIDAEALPIAPGVAAVAAATG